MTTDDKLLTLEEVAELTRTTPSTLRFWRYKGTGPKAARFGRRVIYRASDVQAWIDERFETDSPLERDDQPA